MLTVFSLQIFSQPPRRFDPKRFEMEMQQFIIREAGLTPAEAAKFFPLYDEMQRKQRMLFDEQRNYRFVDPKDDHAAYNAIKKMDDIDLQIKKLQQQYHQKFCKLLPATKVLQIMRADEKFHRQAFKRMVKRKNEGD